MRVDYLASAARGHAGGRITGNVGKLGFNQRQYPAFSPGCDHANRQNPSWLCLEHNHIQLADALDVFRSRGS